MKKMKRDTFFRRAIDNFFPINVYPEFYKDNAIIIDERLNNFTDNAIQIICDTLRKNHVDFAVYENYDFPIDYYTKQPVKEARYYRVIYIKPNNFIQR